MAKSGNTQRKDRKTLQVYFTEQEAAQLEAILAGENFNRWVRAQVKALAQQKQLPFNDDLPAHGGSRKK